MSLSNQPRRHAKPELLLGYVLKQVLGLRGKSVVGLDTNGSSRYKESVAHNPLPGETRHEYTCI